MKKFRQGWIIAPRNVPEESAETVWEHTKKLREAARRLIGRRLPELVERAEIMAAAHDMPEWKMPDYVPGDKVPKLQKQLEEQSVVDEILTKLPKKLREIFRSVWVEYEESETELSILMHDLDKIDAAIQAIIYRRQNYEVSDFFPYALAKVQDEELKNILLLVLDKESKGTLGDPYEEYYRLLSSGL